MTVSLLEGSRLFCWCNTLRVTTPDKHGETTHDTSVFETPGVRLRRIDYGDRCVFSKMGCFTLLSDLLRGRYDHKLLF